MLNRQTKVWLALTVVLSLLALGSACGNKTTDGGNGNAAAPTAGDWKPTGNEGSITGVVAFSGTPPAAKKIDTSADPVCAKESPNLTTEDAAIKDGKVANVFVYIKEGTLTDGNKKIADLGFAPATSAVTLDQHGCHYRPHVLGVQTNQKLSITNSDPTQHNIHPTPKNNPEWNQTQPNGAPPIEKTFARAETLIPVKCNQHPWMKAYIGVLKHPFFTVSAEDGTFTIKGVPPGTYTVVAWREGGTEGTTKTAQVTVAANGSAKADFTFEGATASIGQSDLQVMPALEIPVVGGRH